MNLFLTGAEFSLVDSQGVSPQTNVIASLGGFISSTTPPSNSLNAFFDVISSLTLEEEVIENIALGLINKFDGVSAVNARIISSKGNLASFKIAAVAVPKETYETEKISNRYQEPLDAEFHDATFFRAFVDVTMINSGSIDEVFTLQPFNVECTIKEVVDSVSEFDKVWEAVEKGFENNSDYTVKRLANNKFRIERIDETVESFSCSLETLGGLQLSFEKQFENEVNKTQILIEEGFAKDEALCIWIQRTVKKQKPKSNKQMIIDYDNKEIVQKIETVELFIDYAKI